MVILELNNDTDRFSPMGELPEGAVSQGCFHFGKACAKTVLKMGGELSRIKGYEGNY
jgi:hypothetical protein